MKDNHRISIEQVSGNKDKAVETLKLFKGKNKELEIMKHQKDN